MENYVAYYRVSTEKQGKSGLGLLAQRTIITNFLRANDTVLDEFIEVQSGRIDTRTELWNAINYAKKHGAKILIAKLDRFSRRVSFISGIMDQGISLVVAELPNATEFQLHIFAALAQEERRLISERTKLALREAKKRGTVLGKNGQVLARVNRANAERFAQALEPILNELAKDCRSYTDIARRLNEMGVETYRRRRFYPQTVKNVMARL